MTVRVLSFLLMVLLSGCASSTPSDKTGTWVVLPLSEGPKLVVQCSRSSPKDVTRFWTPSTAQIEAVETRLPALLSTSGHGLIAARFNRQYIGFVRHGKKLIYLSAFPANRTERRDDNDWRKAWIVCDGGDDYWGAEFDPATQTFHDLNFNGEA
jgi:hypothetical protein